MKEWKNKDIIAGLIVIIILGLIALVLLIKRELGNESVYENMPVTEEVYVEEFQEETQEEVLQENEIAETEVTEEMQEESESTEAEIENVTVVTVKTAENSKEIPSHKNALYYVLGSEKYKQATLTERKKDDGQLKELYEYWEDYKLNAVDDLIRLQRFQEMSEELKGTNKFYYYGSVDRVGRPSGKGLAVYEDNTYYFGDWKEGMRHGKGMWLEVAIYGETGSYDNLGLIEHSYNGQWSKDLPNGEGQEHFTYDYDVLEEETLQDGIAISNVIGNFKDGYYHGEMYVMTTDEEGDTLDWSGKCQNGIWEIIMAGNTTNAVWESYEQDGTEEIRYYYMYPADNRDWGVLGLKK